MMFEARRKRLLHRARYRGFKEADILIGGFAENALASMSEAELAQFDALLSCSDHDIFDWVGGAPAPSEISRALIERLRIFEPSRA